MTRTYSKLIQYTTFKDRYEYLNLHGQVGADTFGSMRYLNQTFYHSTEWRLFRREIVYRDLGCDMAFKDAKIIGRIYIHHLNPLTIDDFEDDAKRALMNPENVVCVSLDTHNAIHYGSFDLIKPLEIVERKLNDTIPWRR